MRRVAWFSLQISEYCSNEHLVDPPSRAGDLVPQKRNDEETRSDEGDTGHG